MRERYVVGIDQSTQGTKAILVDAFGAIVGKTYLPHRQLISQDGWVSHDPEEILRNTVLVTRNLIESCAVDRQDVAAIGISNQRETTVAWDRDTGRPVEHAVVWQCARAKEITEQLASPSFASLVLERTGLPLSPYFPAAKAAWLLGHNEEARELAEAGRLCLGTVDSWLIFRLTDGASFKTDYSNASRTQLFNLHSLRWDDALCKAFGVPKTALPEVISSDGDFGETTLAGFFERPVPIRAALGDSHAALFGQGCIREGMAKATYGTGSSIMMNIGPQFKRSESGLVTSLAWGFDSEVRYVLEGNINYAGAVITWLQKDLGLIQSAAESGLLAASANEEDGTYLVPAFSGLGAPYWNSEARAVFCGMSRTTGKAELVKAAVEAIAYQVTDIIEAMAKDAGIVLSELRVDGGPTANEYLMQFQSSMAKTVIRTPKAEELSAIGAAYMAGIAVGLLDRKVLTEDRTDRIYRPMMHSVIRDQKYAQWKSAVRRAIGQ